MEGIGSYEKADIVGFEDPMPKDHCSNRVAFRIYTHSPHYPDCSISLRTPRWCHPSACRACPTCPIVRQPMPPLNHPKAPRLTSVIYPAVPSRPGTRMAYAKVIHAVRPVQRKYLCRLTVISAQRQRPVPPRTVTGSVSQAASRCFRGSRGIVRFHLTSAGSMWIAAMGISFARHCAGGRG